MFSLVVSFIGAAAVGAFLRSLVNDWVGLPWGTLVVNVLGSLLIGFLVLYLGKESYSLRMVVMVAFLGALTTYSGFSLDIVRMLENGEAGKALLYLFSSNLLSVGACYIGFKIAQKLVIAA